MSDYKIIKEYTDNYFYIDKEMFFLSLYNMYRDNPNNIAINRSTIYISEGKQMSVEMYSALLDLPVIEIPYNLDFDSIKRNLYRESYKDEILMKLIANSNNRFCIIKYCNVFYLSRFKTVGFSNDIFINEISDYLNIDRRLKLADLI